MKKLGALSFLGLALLPGTAAGQRPELVVPLKFSPRDLRVTGLALPGPLIDQPIDIRVQDARQETDPRLIGRGTDDDDRLFPIRAANDVLQFATDVISQLAAEQGVKKSTSADRVLNVRVTRFAVTESNKALGSTYSAEVALAYGVSDAGGTTLMEGAVSDEANRYGRARSTGNCSEVLFDALKVAIAKMLSDPSLQAAWISGRPATARAPAPAQTPQGAIEDRLQRLQDLFKKGLITRQEYDARRAEILKEI
jgi:hypothetical protein